MPVQNKTYQMSETELVVLNAFFLALPLPPMLAHDEATAELDLQTVIQQATQTLQAKGWVAVGHANEQTGLVQPELAEMLRGMAYGNQLVHLYAQSRGEAPCQTAFYGRDGQVIGQELSGKAQHKLYLAGAEMGKDQVEAYLAAAPQGALGGKTQVAVDVWHSLLSSRVAGIEAEVLAALEETGAQAVAEDVPLRLAFAKDVLTASLVLEVTCVYDRLANRQEKAAFVLADSANWLVFPATKVSGQARCLVIQATRANMLLTAAGLFAALNSNPDLEGSPS